MFKLIKFEHNMANEKGCDLYLAGRIDRITTAVLFPSTDHAIVQCDLRLGFKYTTEDENVLIRESYDFMKDILKPADEVKEELAWPFKLDAKGKPNEALKDMEKDYIKSMTSIPGSARHEGFTISVLGRFPKFWRERFALCLSRG